MRNLLLFILSISFILAGSWQLATAASVEPPSQLTCEYLNNPMGIDEPAPRFSWQINDARRGAVQSAYQIVVSTDRNKLLKDQGGVWDTGKVQSQRSILAPYEGKTLQSNTRYFWKVRTWDADGKPSPYSKIAFWQMGLLQDFEWQAKWIGFGGKLPAPQRRHNGYHSKISNTPDSTKWVVIDLSKVQQFNSVRLYPAHPFNFKDTPGFLYPVRFRIDVSKDPGFDSFETVVDKTKSDIANPGDAAQFCQFDTVNARYVRLYVSKLAHREKQDYGFALAEMQVLNQDDNLAQGKIVTGLDTIDDDSWSQDRLTDGVTIPVKPGKNWSPHPSPMLRKGFNLPAPIKHATLSATALGLYEIFINGQRISQNLLAPEWTDYNIRIQYQTYDVTAQLSHGKNAIGAMLGDGWYAGRIGLIGLRVYGDQLALLAQLDVTCTDGSRHLITTDSSWRGTLEGPIRGADIIHGEMHDARRVMPDWNNSAFDDANWGVVNILSKPQAKLVPQINQPIQITEKIKPVKVTEPKPDVFVYDLGQNMVGWCRLVLQGAAGTKVTLRYAEMLDPNGAAYMDNMRGPFQIDEFILDGSDNCVFEPRFTYHGFRYLEVTGLTEAPPLENITGMVFHSASPMVSSFECSSPMLNKLMKNILWTQRGNMHSTPTDCPQRDERLGWMGDAQIFSQAGCFNMNMAAFYNKWLQDVRDAQTDKGQYSDFSPNPVMGAEQFVAAPAWADAGVIIPWRMYVNYGDKRIIARHYASMKRWVDYVQKNSVDYIWTKGRGNDYGDWLNADTLILENWPKKGGAISKEQIATAFAAHSVDLLSRMAQVIGKESDAQKYAELFKNIRHAFIQKYFEANGRNKEDNQTAYALALHFNLIPTDQRDNAVQHILRKIKDYNGHISTGIQATNRMMLELTEEGQNDVAYQLLNNRTIPSLGYMIDNGATTIWERWDGWVDGRGFQNTGMNSFNHYALGAVGEWMFRNIAGINPDPSAPAYKHIIIHPRPGGGVTYANTTYNSIRGPIITKWRIENKTFTLDVTIPANSSAAIVLPTSDLSQVSEQQGSLQDSKYIEIIQTGKDGVTLKASSGNYKFSVRLAE